MALIGLHKQPLSNLSWVHRDELFPNDYNPNHVAPAELELLKISIENNGWTQPIVALPSDQIVDGFHRWTVSLDKRIYQMTDGLVPVVRMHQTEPDEQRLATIRHNRARGTHGVLKMADIVRSLVEECGHAPEAVAKALSMEMEEVDRLLDKSGMLQRGSAGHEFNQSWGIGSDDGDN